MIEDLHDIQSITPIDWWPLASGWWMLLTLAVLAICGLVVYLVRRARYRKSQAYKLLMELQYTNDMSHLSELIKKIAIWKFGREECAALSNQQWLAWLEKHDQQQFPWTKKASGLLDDKLYAPQKANNQELHSLKQAIGRWLV